MNRYPSYLSRLTPEQCQAYQIALHKLALMAMQGQVPSARTGICDNVHSLLMSDGHHENSYTVINVICALATTWPGSVSPGRWHPYPVPAPILGDLPWKGKSLGDRLSLIAHAIYELEHLHAPVAVKRPSGVVASLWRRVRGVFGFGRDVPNA
jgi:hypothetical protein